MKVEGTFICSDCYHVFGGYGDSGCLKCKQKDYFPIDELLVPAVITLNKKGFKTKGCCSGHLFYGEGYIWFDKRYNLPIPPSGFEIEEEFLRWNICEESEPLFNKQEKIIQKVEQLNQYVNTL